MNNNDTYSPSGFRILPPVTKNLLIINILLFLATLVLAQRGIDLIDILGLHYIKASKFAPYQFITYMFMHGGFSHIFFNMFAVWMFGTVLEQVWGSKRYLFFYLFTGIGAALVHYLIFYYQTQPIIQGIDAFLTHPSLQTLNEFVRSHKFYVQGSSSELSAAFDQFNNYYAMLQTEPTNTQALQGAVNFISLYKEEFLNMPVVVGASGAIFGLLLAFGMMFPNSMIYLYFFIPMKAKWFVIIYGLLELFSGFYDTSSNVAHFAHLGGMLFGLILILYWRKKDRNKYIQRWQ